MGDKPPDTGETDKPKPPHSGLMDAVQAYNDVLEAERIRRASGGAPSPLEQAITGLSDQLHNPFMFRDVDVTDAGRTPPKPLEYEVGGTHGDTDLAAMLRQRDERISAEEAEKARRASVVPPPRNARKEPPPPAPGMVNVYHPSTDEWTQEPKKRRIPKPKPEPTDERPEPFAGWPKGDTPSHPIPPTPEEAAQRKAVQEFGNWRRALRANYDWKMGRSNIPPEDQPVPLPAVASRWHPMRPIAAWYARQAPHVKTLVAIAAAGMPILCSFVPNLFPVTWVRVTALVVYIIVALCFVLLASETPRPWRTIAVTAAVLLFGGVAWVSITHLAPVEGTPAVQRASEYGYLALDCNYGNHGKADWYYSLAQDPSQIEKPHFVSTNMLDEKKVTNHQFSTCTLHNDGPSAVYDVTLTFAYRVFWPQRTPRASFDDLTDTADIPIARIPANGSYVLRFFDDMPGRDYFIAALADCSLATPGSPGSRELCRLPRTEPFPVPKAFTGAMIFLSHYRSRTDCSGLAVPLAQDQQECGKPPKKPRQ